MKIDVSIASVLGSVFLVMFAIISYFLRAVMNKLTEIEKDKNQTALDMARLQSDVKNMSEEQHEMRERIKGYDNKNDSFWRDFPKMINEALAPQFDALKMRLGALENDIREGK